MKIAKILAILTAVLLTALVAGYVGFRYTPPSKQKAEILSPLDKSEERQEDEVASAEILVPEAPETPAPVAFDPEIEQFREVRDLEEKLIEIVGEDNPNVGVYIKDLSTGLEYGLNEDEFFPPASVSKVPYGILTLKYIDEGKLSYDTRLTMYERHKFYTTDPLYEYANGTTWSIRDLLRLLLVDSDNIPMNMLEEYFGGAESFNRQIAELGITNFTRYPHQATPRAVGETFEKIYRGDILSEESTAVLREHLSRYKVFSGDRLRLGIDRAAGRDTVVVHKIGNLNGTYHDAGYVLGPKKDFIIVTLNQNRSVGQAITEITAMAAVTYEHFNGE